MILVVGEVTARNRSAFEQAVREVLGSPGSWPVEINMVLARVADVEALSELFDAYDFQCPEIRSAK
jgi:hypothetical protein